MKNTSYMKLYSQLRDAITSDVYPFGDKLPGKRVIADHSGFSLSTVEHALQLLEEEGYVESRQRSGCYVSYRSQDFNGTMEKIVPAGINSVPSHHEDESMPSSILSHTIRRILTEHAGGIFQSTDGKGLLSLRQSLARYLARARGIHVQADQIIIGSGSEYIYSLIVQLLGRSRIYGIEDPSYEKIAAMYRANGVRIDPLKMGTRGILTSELERTPASVLHITPYHSYPTGITADAAKRREYIEWAVNRNALLVEDDYDSEFTVSSKPEDTLFSLGADHTVIYLNTFSRTIAPGIRVSYMLLPSSLINLYEKKAGFYASTVSTLSQLLIEELLDSGEFERHVNRVRRKRRKQLNQSTGNTQ